MSDGEVRIRVPPTGGRLDSLLASQASSLSRSRWQELIKDGLVLVDGDPVTKPAFGLSGGETIEASIPAAEQSRLSPEAIPLDILYEDENVLVVNKPAGMVVHPSPGHDRGTLVHAALAHAPDVAGVGGKIRPGVVHRLDKDTSGIIVLAKNDRAHHWLQRQFKEREVEKIYLALVDGRPPTPEGLIRAPVGRHKRRRKQMAVLPKGKGRPAETTYRTLEQFPEHSLLEVEPRTGRTHQIRVHLAYLNCPVAGDTVYGQRRPSLALERQFLHAHRLAFRMPGSKRKRAFEAPLASDLQSVLEDLRRA